jgi:8-hydroxy-5-deazaflavin:NADPH oxidoreductase
MRMAVLGTGMVGRAIASKLVELGHEVRMGSRSAGNENAVAWAEEAGERAGEGTFADAAGFGEVIFNCTAGSASLDALTAAGKGNLAGKLLIDISNPLDYSHGMPPSLTICNTDSLAERIQAAFPEARVVKSLNTINCEVMVEPTIVPGDHVIFVCGNDADARHEARVILEEFGWPPERVVDLGDISAARGTEMYLPLWVRLVGPMGGRRFNIALMRG